MKRKGINEIYSTRKKIIRAHVHTDGKSVSIVLHEQDSYGNSTIYPFTISAEDARRIALYRLSRPLN